MKFTSSRGLPAVREIWWPSIKQRHPVYARRYYIKNDRYLWQNNITDRVRRTRIKGGKTGAGTGPQREGSEASRSGNFDVIKIIIYNITFRFRGEIYGARGTWNLGGRVEKIITITVRRFSFNIDTVEFPVVLKRFPTCKRVPSTRPNDAPFLRVR